MARRIISKVQYLTISDAVDQPLIPYLWKAKSAQKSVDSTNKPSSSSGVIVQIPISENIIKLNIIQHCFNLLKNLQ